MLVAPFQSVVPGMGLLPLVKAFAIVVVGGMLTRVRAVVAKTGKSAGQHSKR